MITSGLCDPRHGWTQEFSFYVAASPQQNSRWTDKFPAQCHQRPHPSRLCVKTPGCGFSSGPDGPLKGSFYTPLPSGEQASLSEIIINMKMIFQLIRKTLQVSPTCLFFVIYSPVKSVVNRENVGSVMLDPEFDIFKEMGHLCKICKAVGANRKLVKPGGAQCLPSGVICLVVAVMYWLGWEMGAVEAISLSILVGSSVDYCLHLVEGYLLAGETVSLMPGQSSEPSAERQRRTLEAVNHVGVAIVSSAVTTAISTVPLFFCVIVPFAKFGQIVAINTAISILFTLSVTSALLACMAPAHFSRHPGAVLKASLAVVAAAALGGALCWTGQQLGASAWRSLST
ncbi:hypothetical protein GOODEAATRI_016460 [Goodea atripinnis]|uniref:DUF7023 domain-containing protein n=1 Tax=Goodea atripinnis TaxID=208336 RepID=A0ABV0P4W7_9TELE